MKKYLIFMSVSYIFAFSFEYLAYKVGNGGMFRISLWWLPFITWYGFWYSATFKFLAYRPIWIAIIVWAILGPILEITVFGRVIWLDAALYAFFFATPVYIFQKFINKT